MQKLPKHLIGLRVAGCDEVGRGCLAGPVASAAVVLDPAIRRYPSKLTDSKKLKSEERLEVREWILNHCLDWAVGWCNQSTIDHINILQASVKSMHMALSQLRCLPEHILVDGHYFHPYQGINYDCIIKGDLTYHCIAAASILAKTARDEWMMNLHGLLPQYGWVKNKGYPTKEHKMCILDQGLSPWHRRSFRTGMLAESK